MIETHIGSIKSMAAELAVVRARHMSAQLEGVVGSPIEAVLACSLATIIGGMDSRLIVALDDESVPVSGDFYIRPQYQIGRYRVDFLVGRNDEKVIIECDGRAYHYSTREQIERDRERDNVLVESGWRVLRYPATQIHNDTAKVAFEIVKAVDGAFFERWRETLIRFRR